MRTVAITGTNGKTSSIAFTQQILDHLKIPNASVGTRGIVVNGVVYAHVRTKNNSDILPVFTEGLKKQGIQILLVEAHSSALSRGAWNNFSPEICVFTGLGRDHLDIHGTLDNYWSAKKKLFKLGNSKTSIITTTDPLGKELINEHYSRVKKIFTCGKNGIFQKNISKKDFSKSLVHIQFENFSEQIELSFYADLMVDNLLFAIAIVTSLGIEPQCYIDILQNLKPPKGRYETIITKVGVIVIDYAHTPDALENILNIVTPMTQGKVHLVFGCGGNKDKGKRRLMGGIASRANGNIYITDDNPRNEDPSEIRKEILAACTAGIELSDRKKAISLAISKMEKDDSLLVLGKGDEEIQVRNGKEVPFSDREHIMRAIKDSVKY